MCDRKDVRSHRALIFCAWAYPTAWAATIAMVASDPALPPPAEYDSIFDAIRFQRWFMLAVFCTVLPPVIAILLSRRWQTGVRDWGLRRPRLVIVCLAPLVALSIHLIAVSLAVGTGLGRFDPTGMAQVERLVDEGDHSGAVTTALLLRSHMIPSVRRMLIGIFAGLVIGTVASPIIELAWRGLLHTELRWMGFGAVSVVAGVLSAAWWVPLLLTAPMAGARTLAGFLGLGAYVLMGAPLAWIREVTESIIPGSVLLMSWVLMLDLPTMMVRDITDTQLGAVIFASSGLLASAALFRPPRAFRRSVESERETGGDPPEETEI